MANPRRLSFYRIGASHFEVMTSAGTTLGEVRRMTGPQGRCWRATVPDGAPIPRDFATRQVAAEALFMAADDRYRAASDADLGRDPVARRSTPDGSTFYVDVMDNCLVVSLEHPSAGTVGEFSLRWVYDEACRPRLQAYQDGWKVLEVSGLLPFMALWAEDISMAKVVGCLRGLGFTIRDHHTHGDPV